MTKEIHWWVVDEPQYDGFIGGIYGRFVFTISYQPSRTDTRPFVLGMNVSGEAYELGIHDTPHDAMKAAAEYMEGRQWEGDSSG